MQDKLPHGEVHIWLTFPSKIRSPQLVDSYRELLSHEERERYCRYKFDEDRHRYLVGKALLRTTLSKYSPVPPHKWKFEANQFGRPRLPVDQTVVPMHFSQSYARGLVGCGIVLGRSIGIDIENITRSVDHAVIAEKFFSPAEVMMLRNTPP